MDGAKCFQFTSENISFIASKISAPSFSSINGANVCLELLNNHFPSYGLKNKGNWPSLWTNPATVQRQKSEGIGDSLRQESYASFSDFP